MIEIRNANRYGALTEERLALLEDKLECRLPDDYRAFLLAYNGGQPTLSRFTFEVDDEEQESILEWFFAVHDREPESGKGWRPSSGTLPPYFSQSLESVWEDFREEQPEDGLLPIARDPSGNVILIGFCGDWAGAVWWYDHEMGEFVRLGDSFGAFLATVTKLEAGNWADWLMVD